RGRVNAVRLVETWVGGDAVEQKWHESHPGAPSDVRKYRLEFLRVLRPVVGRQTHTREQDGGAGSLQALDDRRQVVAHRLRALGPKPVVGAERDDDDFRLGAQDPVDAPQAASRSVAAHAGVDHTIGVALAGEPRLEPRRIRLVGRDAQARGQAVAERDDYTLPARLPRAEGPQRARRDRSCAQCSMSFVMIRVRDVVMRLPSGGRSLTILDGITLDVAAGEVVAITGPSGSGKSTLLGLVAGLDRPSEGSIVVAGIDITRLDED